MKRHISLSFLFVVLLAVLTSSVLLHNTQAKQNNETTNITDNPIGSTTETTVNKAVSDNNVPDNIAYELFFRTIGANNARGLVKRAGLSDEQIKQVIAEAKSLNESYESADKYKRQLREDKNKTATQKQHDFQQVKEQNEVNLSRVINNYLPQRLGQEEWQKLQKFIETEVKSNIQTIPVASLGKNKPKNNSKVQFVKTASKRAAQTGNSVYLYSAAWSQEGNVFGSGTLAEDSTSYQSYLVTTTVTSPSGRTNTTNGGWGYATLSNSTGLSLGVENGLYNVQATFSTLR